MRSNPQGIGASANHGSIYDREWQVNTNMSQKETREEGKVLSDCFNTTAFEHQARCSICPKSLAV